MWILIHTSHFPAAYEPAFDGERAASLCHTGICDRKGQPTQTRAATTIVTILYGVTTKWTLPSCRKLTDFQSVVRIDFRFSSIITARNSRNSEPAEKRKTNDLSLTRTCFPLYFSKFINIPLDIEKAVNSVESTAL